MATKITVTHGRDTYELEYSRNSVKYMEDNGFVLDQVGDKPMTMIPLLVYGAFLKHNRGIKRNVVDEVYKNIVDKTGKDGEDGFIQVLLEMYSETVLTLTDNDEVDEGNAATWKVTRS